MVCSLSQVLLLQNSACPPRALLPKAVLYYYRTQTQTTRQRDQSIGIGSLQSSPVPFPTVQSHTTVPLLFKHSMIQDHFTGPSHLDLLVTLIMKFFIIRRRPLTLRPMTFVCGVPLSRGPTLRVWLGRSIFSWFENAPGKTCGMHWKQSSVAC